MVTTQEWTAPIYPPVPTLDDNGAPVIVAGKPVLIREGNKKAEIVLFDHPVRHTKPGQPDAHARRIKTIGERVVEEVYLTRSYLVTRVTGTYAGTNARAVFADSTGRVLQQQLLHAPGGFMLQADALPLAIGFKVTLEHLGPDFAEGAITVTFRQEETEVSRA
jgi:hypothetical protein